MFNSIPFHIAGFSANTLALVGAIESDILDGWGKLTAIGALSALLAIMIFRTIPKLVEGHTEAQKASAAAFSNAMDGVRNDLKEHNNDQLDLLRAYLEKK